MSELATQENINPVDKATAALKEKYPDLTDDPRDGYSGLMVAPDKIVEVARTLREELGFNFLSSVTGVDLIKEDKMEVVYHTYSIDQGGSALVLKVQVDRNNPVMPSLTPEWRGADFQEREIYDMYGIKFEGHPYLRRILMWDGFEGYPMRKDWKEAFYEEESKPFGSRWPGGEVFRAENRNPYGKNVKYPEGYIPNGLSDDTDDEIYAGLTLTPGKDLNSDLVTVNLGPQHPSTHGVFRMVATLDGETVRDLKPVMGYLHRNHEKIGERNTWLGNIPYTDRLDYLSSMGNNHGYCLAVEKLMGASVPERAEWIRMIMVELTRIANHLWALGFLLNDVGALQTPMLYFYVERELILDFFEAVAGSRMMCNYMRFGGLAYDLPADIRGQETMAFLEELVNTRLPKAFDEWTDLVVGNEILRARTIGVGYLAPDDAINMSCVGPLLRGSGVPYDIRKAEPYSYYDQIDFDVAVRYNGDVFDRLVVRLDEMWESLKIVKQILPHLYATKGAPIFAGKSQYAIRMPHAGEAYARVENPKGELGFYITTERRGQNPERYHIRAPSFINLTALGPMSIGAKVADLVTILGSIDIVLGEVDR